MIMGHLGNRVSALVDGMLPPDEEERAWAHVHTCHLCRDLVEREGWVKTRLAGLGRVEPAASEALKGSIVDRTDSPCAHGWAAWTTPPGDVFLEMAHASRPRRAVGLVAIGGGAVGAAMMGVLALGAAPADAPTIDRRVPQTSITQPGPAQLLGPSRRNATPRP